MSDARYHEKDVWVDLDDIDPELRPSSQMRARMDEDQIGNYAEVFNDLPPVILIADPAISPLHWLVDGGHRIHAARLCKKTRIKAKVRIGSFEDAFREASRANAKNNSVPIRRADKKHRVEQALKQFYGSKKHEEIAELCDVARSYVTQLTANSECYSNIQGGTLPSITNERGQRRPAKYKRRKSREPKPEEHPEQPATKPVPEPEPTADYPKEPKPQPEPAPAPKPNGKPRGKAPEKPTPQPEPAPATKPTQKAPAPSEPSDLITVTDEPVDWEARWVEAEKLIVNVCEGWDKEARPYFAAELLGLAIRLRDIYCPGLVVKIDEPMEEGTGS